MPCLVEIHAWHLLLEHIDLQCVLATCPTTISMLSPSNRASGPADSSFLSRGHIIPVLGMCLVIGRYSEAVPLRKNMKRTFKAQWPIGQVTIWRMAIRSPAMRLRTVKQITHGGTWAYPSSLLKAFNRSHVFAHRQGPQQLHYHAC